MWRVSMLVSGQTILKRKMTSFTVTSQSTERMYGFRYKSVNINIYAVIQIKRDHIAVKQIGTR